MGVLTLRMFGVIPILVTELTEVWTELPMVRT